MRMGSCTALQSIYLAAAAAVLLSQPVTSREADPRIQHFVILFMENRPFDHYFGCMDLPGADSAATMTRNRTLPIDPANPAAGSVNVTCGTAKYTCGGGMGYSIFSGKFAPGSNVSHVPYGPQSDINSGLHGAKGEAIKMFAPAQIPVKAAIARNFGVFNKLYSSVPAASTPNHLFAQSATSCGAADNIVYSECGGDNVTFPQMTICKRQPVALSSSFPAD